MPITINTLTINPYRIPFVKPFETAHGQMLFREGALLKVEATTPQESSKLNLPLTGWGEAAPLPDFGEGGTLTETLILLNQIKLYLPNTTIEELLAGKLEFIIGEATASLLQKQPNLKFSQQVSSVVRFGLELAFFDILAQAQQQPLAVFWGATLAPLPVNATIGTPSLDGAVESATRLAQAGFECFKLKVGVASTAATEIARVAAVRQALDKIGQGLRLRLDANEAWSVPQAISLLQQLSQYDLELVEQPVSASDMAGLAQVRYATGLKIAADEAITSLSAGQKIIQSQAADVLVIKPAFVGGIQATRQLIQLAETAGLQVLITSTLDTGVGIAAALHLALLLKRPPLACGLATTTLLENTLTEITPPIQNGLMFPSGEIGLGLKISPKLLQHYYNI
jgi:o-succinylbenzoate synthase